VLSTCTNSTQKTKDTEDFGGGMPIQEETALAEGERAGGADPNLIRIFGLMWGTIRTIDPWVESHSLQSS
jgi:hypothetical protein